MATPTLLGTSADAKLAADSSVEDVQDIDIVQTQETPAKEDTEAKAETLKEFGGPVTLASLFSLATAGEKAIFVLGILGATAHGAGQPLLCLMFGDLIDSLTPPGTISLTNSTSSTDSASANDVLFENVSNTALTFVLIGGGAMVAASIQGACFPWFVEAQLAKMRPLYFDAILHRDVSWFDTHNVGALADEMGAELDIYGDGFGTKLGVSIMSASGVVIGLIVAFTLSWEVSLLMLVTFPLMGFGALIMAKAMLDMTQETQGAYAKAAEMADEVLFAIRTVVSFGGEARELSRYTAAAEIARKGGLSNRIKQGVGMGYVWLIYFASMALAFWFAMTLVYNDVEEELTVGNLMSCFFCVLTVGFTVGQIAPGLSGMIGAKASMARFFYILKHEAIIQRRVIEERKDMAPIESMALQNVSFSYPARPDVRVLSGLNLSIQKGQKVAVVGESGSGKSTVMALLERFYDPSDGLVLVNGEDLRNFAVASYRKHIGYVGQEPVLFATSVHANIMMGCPTATAADLLSNWWHQRRRLCNC